MPSKSKQVGYLSIDHRDSPGLSAADGFDPRMYGKGVWFEADCNLCKHCQRQVIKNPFRARPRGYCPKCDHYVCDRCEGVRVATGGECICMEQRIDRFLKKRIHEGLGL